MSKKSIHSQRKTTTHISPNLDGLAPETHEFVAYLNEEAAQHKTRVRFVATANRIQAVGNLKRAAMSTTLGGWLLRRAITAGYTEYEKRRVWHRRAIDKQTDAEIESEKPVLKRGNSLHRRKLRKWEKNRRVGVDTLDHWRDRWRRRNLVIDHRGRKLMPAERIELAELTELVRLVRLGERLLSPQEALELKVNRAAETLYHLIGAIPQAERDRQEIYPGDFLRAVISEPLPEKMRLPDCGIRDYSEPAVLLFKFGGYQRVIRQKAASPVWRILESPRRWARDCGLGSHWDSIWRDCEIRLSLYALGRLKTPEEQWTLNRIGRLYKNSCWYPRLKKRPRLFDKCERLSWQAGTLWKPGQVSIQLENAEKLAGPEQPWREAKLGGQVIHLGPPAKRHARLASTQAAYNEQWPSYWNIGRTKRAGWDFGIREPKTGIAGVSEILREQGSLNIPRGTIEARDNMVANLKHDFGHAWKQKVA